MNLEQTPFRSVRELYQTPAVFPASVYAYPGVTQIFMRVFLITGKRRGFLPVTRCRKVPRRSIRFPGSF